MYMYVSTCTVIAPPSPPQKKADHKRKTYNKTIPYTYTLDYDSFVKHAEFKTFKMYLICTPIQIAWLLELFKQKIVRFIE